MRPNTVHVSYDRSHTSPWEVYVYEAGKKVRLARAKTKKEAETLQRKYQEERNRRGTDAPLLNAAQTAEYLRARKALGPDVSLDVVVADYLGRVEKPSVGLGKAIEGFLAELEARKLAKTSVRDYRCKLEGLARAHPGVNVEFFAQLPGAEPHPLLKFILGVSEDAQTRIHYRTKIGTFLRWCEARNWLSVHPNKWIKLGRVSREAPRFYSPEVAETIFRLFEKRCPRLIPLLALEAFFALRPSEG